MWVELIVNDDRFARREKRLRLINSGACRFDMEISVL